MIKIATHLSVKAILALGSALSLSLLTSCAVTDTTDSGNATQPETVIDSKNTRMVTPGQQITLAWEEAADISYAVSITHRQCMRDAGFPQGPAYNIRDELEESVYSAIGVWTESVASEFGYSPIPPSEAKQQLLNDDGDKTDLETERACNEDPSVKPFFDIDQEFSDTIWNGILNGSVIDENRRERLHSDWSTCMKDSGIVTVEDSFIPTGVTSMTQEESISTALTDVECKRSTGFIDGWAQLLADEQRPYLEKHRSSLDDFRTRALKVRESAQDVIYSYERTQP